MAGTDFAFTEAGDSLVADESSILDSGMSCFDMSLLSATEESAISKTPSFSATLLRVDSSSEVDRNRRCAIQAAR